MRTRFHTIINFVIFIALIPGGVAAQVEIEQAYVRAMPPTTSNTAAYLNIRNSGTDMLELIGAYSPIAASTMLHETVSQDGMLKMQHIMSVSIEPGETLVLEPGGKHLMLMGVGSTPEEGQEVEITLRFRHADDLTLLLPVKKDF